MDEMLVVDDGLLRRRLRVLRDVVQRELDGQMRPFKLASIMAERYRWPRLRTLADVWQMKVHGVEP